jgi:hypothetical protein
MLSSVSSFLDRVLVWDILSSGCIPWATSMWIVESLYYLRNKGMLARDSETGNSRSIGGGP